MDPIIQVYLQELEAWAMDVAPKLVIALGIVVGGIVAAQVLRMVLSALEARTVKRTDSRLDDVVMEKVNKIILYVFYSVVAVLAFGAVDINATPWVIAILAVLMARPVADIINALLHTVEKRVVHQTDSRLDDVVFPLVRKGVIFTVYIFAVIIALDQLGIEVVPFIAGMGIAGIAIGFAAKDTLANIIAGIFIIIDRPFVLGDRIEVWSAPKQSATWGDVIEIGLRTTKIRTTDNITLIIPNSEIYRRDIINYTTETPVIRVRLPVGISYRSDEKKAEEIMLKIAEETEGVEKSPPPQVIFKQFGESSIDLELRVWVSDAKKRRPVTSKLGKRIKEEFDRHGIEIPYPKRDVYIHEVKES
ncbi:MAG: mechanosensitive ion channel family protein [Euryarchaeota archaeon]|nr:mechanosensitive ion channel family protein [Euryarchaeota archaeon]